MNRAPRPTELIAALALGVLALAASAAPAAHADRAFEQRFVENVRGDIAFAANTSVTCGPPDTCGRHSSTSANNGGFLPAFVDVDLDPTTRNSSRATLDIPAGADVLFAGLYWGGRPELETTGSAVAVTPAEFAQVKLATPTSSGGYVPITGDGPVDEVVFGTNSNLTWQASADVTDVVEAAGPGAYTVADVRLEGVRQTSNGSWGGWTLVVAYSHPAERLRNLAVFDGLEPVLSGGSSVDIPLSGFVTPPAPAAVNTTIGLVGYEGDRGTGGDTLTLIQGANETPISDAVTPVNNVFNSGITRQGVDVGDRTPAYLNQLGYDSKLIDTVDALGNSTSSMIVRVATGSDGLAPGVITTATDLYMPLMTATKSVENVDRPGALDAHPGEELEYSVTVGNEAGDIADIDVAADVVLSDAIPAGTTYVPGSLEMVSGEPAPAGSRTDAAGDDSAEIAGGDAVFRVGDGADATDGGTLAPGESATVSFRVTVDPGTTGDTLVNAADVDFAAQTTGDEFSEPSNEVQTPVTDPVVDLDLDKTATPLVDPGEEVTWTLTVSNAGPDASPGATVTDTLPAGVTNIQTSTPGCNVAGSTVTCAVGPLPAGGAHQIVITGDSPMTPSECFENEAAVDGDDPDPQPGNDTDSAVTCNRPAADLELIKTATPVVDPGGQVTWALTVINNGPDASPGATVTDTLPAGFTNIQSSTAGCSVAGSTVTCAVGALDPGDSAGILITADAPQATATCFDNDATVTGDIGDVDPADNEASARTCTTPTADLELAKAAPSVVDPGERITWTLTVTNAGPDRSSGSTVTDTLPAGVANAQSATPGCSVAGGSVTCDVGPLDPGQSTEIVVTGDAPLSPSTCVDNEAVVEGDEGDPNPNNDDATARTCTTPAADLRLDKAADPVVDPGGPVTWTLTVTNDGPNQSTGSTVTDTIPAGVTNVQAITAGCTVQGNAVTCDVGPLAPDESTDIVIAGDAPSTPSTCFDNHASVLGAEGDPRPGNDDASARTCTTPAADLALAKTATATVDPGGRVAWTLTVRNEGPSQSTGSTVTDALPAVVTNVQTETAGCSVQGNTVTCDVGPLGADESAEIVVTGDAPRTSSTCFANQASVHGVEGDPQLGDNERSAQTCTTAAADLGLAKTGPTTVERGSQVAWTLTVTNHGPGDSTGATVVDTLPAAVADAATATPGCAVVGGEVRCQVGPLAAGASTAIAVTATAPTADSTCFENSATVTANGNDPQPANDSDSARTCTADAAAATETTGDRRPAAGAAKPRLRVTKTVAKRRVRAGGTVRYTIRVTNPSRRAARNVRVCDQLPSGMTALRATPRGKLSKGRYCWTAKRIGARKAKRYRLTVRVLPGASGRKVNTATAAGAGVRGRARASARPVRVLPRQAAGGGVTG